MTTHLSRGTVRGPATYDDVVRVDGRRLVAPDGSTLVLRGVGLGSWMLPEGYMFRTGTGPQSPRAIEALVTDLVGPERGAAFWRAFHDTFVTEGDIAAIAAAGFDHVRLPINARLVHDGQRLLPDGVELIDRTIAWCRAHGLWVLLDLHGAHGGQTGTNIDDSPNERPELFEDDTYRRQTVHLWRQLAERYADENAVLGYDLLNEPLPNEWQHRYADKLVDLYKELTATIREVDQKHLIMYEGTHWSTNFDIFSEIWDKASVLQFHKYWSAPDRPSIERFIETASRLDLPLYMGEGGENNPRWLAAAFGMYEDLGIGWNFWTWKKLGTLTSPLSVEPPAGWAEIVAYGEGRGARPGSDAAWETLEDLVEAMRVEACTPRPEIVAGLLRLAPLTLPAIAYGHLGVGRSYGGSSGAAVGPLRGDDPVRVTYLGDGEPDFDLVDGLPGEVERDLVVELDEGEWVAYACTAPADGVREFVLETRDGQPELVVDGDVVPLGAAPGEGGWTRWTGNAVRPVGPVRIVVRGASTLRSVTIR
ncbi:glycoside hydrolase family 5 protein [Sanguibacter sp. HDW7]|uniref:glycoside hydrolase family 5 protein n=1 Tax=Sanguibacter sp. HDW7 TaxID=2714931 RepID=UPI0019801AA2|nr:cellulase family glycosylhydrolase [Sanguibacter sp. HDW7]